MLWEHEPQASVSTAFSRTLVLENLIGRVIVVIDILSDVSRASIS